jgi:PadR family transcriptional regulator, regulatory protein PadR
MFICIPKFQMYICPMYSSELIKGTLKTIVLSLLSKHGQMYGYEITQHVKDQTKGKIQLTEGALYPLLHRLEAEKLLTTEKVNIGKRVRKYYKLTKSGTQQATSLVDEFRAFTTTMNNLLNSFNQNQNALPQWLN